ncbi:MBL fold metallo-hydrolase [Actibacterium sp. 188UL27-1]|uniref:MBL fold metallo-hydrolase n=1 Tax=Actibacterium sp. 188UL27-1 TaxID=2786961 RepID=UPI00195D5598|nr:MBL fold metallo-hydrolase [Actibacterium sp. 188UL27-1]MBM7069335.1 MBL fold metallo-hydrolase [Actibacterium sp. 188UL27-1]
MKLTFLGTGTPEPYLRRASSGYLIEHGADRILFDCGGGVFDRLLQAGHLPQNITHLVFSHLHSDHMMDYARLVHAAWDARGVPLKVFGPAPMARITEQLFGRDGVFGDDLRARTQTEPSQQIWLARGGTLPRRWPTPEVVEIAPGDTIAEPGWKLTAVEVPHAQPALICLGLRLEAGDKVFAYSGDAALCDGMKQLAADADLLLHWCYRMDGEALHPALDPMAPTPGQIAAMANAVGVKRLRLTHIRPHMDQPGHHQAMLAAARQVFDGDLAIAEDLDQITL